MNKIAILVFSLSLFAHDLSIKRRNQINKILKPLKSQLIIKELRNFVSCCKKNRTINQKGNLEALSYLKARIAELDPNYQNHTQEQVFMPKVDVAINRYESDFQNKVAKNFSSDSPEYQKWAASTQNITSYLRSLKGIKQKNLIWHRKAKAETPNTVVLLANFDSVIFNEQSNQLDFTSSHQGANDNGSAVAILLNLIKLLKDQKLKTNVLIVFTNFQELGFLGSQAFYEDFLETQLKSAKIIPKAIINLLMLGHDTKSKDKTKKYGNYKIYTRLVENTKDLEWAQELEFFARNFSSSIRYKISPSKFELSDNVPFWEQNIPMIVVSGDLENDLDPSIQHTPQDFVEIINRKSYHQVTKGLIGAILNQVVL